jgi:succinate dehydrogenase/fumarate reductase flavoprotein subunit
MGYPCSSATADGDAMAYRVGAEISGKEFNDAHGARRFNPLGQPEPSPMKEANVLGGGPPSAPGPAEQLDARVLGLNIRAAFGVHYGGLPIDPRYLVGPGSLSADSVDENRHIPFTESPGFSTPGMSNHKGEGVFPRDLFGASNVPGLWAAGDGLCSMQNGAAYAGFGCSCAGSAVQGDRAGRAAAECANNERPLAVPESVLKGLVDDMLTPLTRPRGYSCAWVTRLLQNTMFPYYVMYVKEKGRLQVALSQIMYLQQKCAPELKARDPHDLRMAHETRNMLLNAEMKLRAGLAREESRGTHFREDFPFRDDANWLCWVKLVGKDGEMTVVKHPIPAKWHPDPSLPYRDKYPAEFPGEDAHLARLAAAGSGVGGITADVDT